MDKKELTKKIKEIEPIISLIEERGGSAYLVGGVVRDLVLGLPTKDIDIEVHGLSIDDLEEILKKIGPVSLVGKQFGVLKLHKFDIDWSLPRKDSKGRKPTVIVDPDMTIEQASMRRDVTMNAMAIKLLPGEQSAGGLNPLDIIDPHGGLEDIKNKKLRLVDKELFLEDPLRFYRVMQFVARFEMTPDDELNQVCKTMELRDATSGGELARERIYEEIKKLLLKSKRPSLGFRWVKKIGRLKELFPEIGDLVGVQQREDYHPEGDVFEHTMQCIDASAKLESDDNKKFMIMLSVLCHDFGKPKTTDENLHTKGHEKAGVPIAKTFLRRFTWDSMLTRSVCKLVKYHMMPAQLVEQKSSNKAYKRLALKLAPEVTLKDLYLVAWADSCGRNKDGHEPLSDGFEKDILADFWKKAQEAKVETGPEKPVLQGRDLMGLVEPGPQMGLLLKKAYQIQIDQDIKDKDELKRLVLED